MDVYKVGMCISITEADAICIAYDTLKIHMKQLAMRRNMIHPYYDAVRFDAILCNGKNMITYFFGLDRQQIIN